MKKIATTMFQLISLFIFIVLVTGIYSVIKEILQNNKGVEYNLGYSVAAVIVLGILFWMNLKLYRFTSTQLENHKSKKDKEPNA